MIEVGFTGTRNGMTDAQKNTVQLRLIELSANPAEIEAHHGDCIGADADFHAICRELGVGKIVAHPGHVSRELRAFTDADEVRDPKPPLDRNSDIVFECLVMIATPTESVEQQRSGTWSTIRKARRSARRLTVVYPDGRIALR